MVLSITYATIHKNGRWLPPLLNQTRRFQMSVRALQSLPKADGWIRKEEKVSSKDKLIVDELRRR